MGGKISPLVWATTPGDKTFRSQTVASTERDRALVRIFQQESSGLLALSVCGSLLA